MDKEKFLKFLKEYKLALCFDAENCLKDMKFIKGIELFVKKIEQGEFDSK